MSRRQFSDTRLIKVYNDFIMRSRESVTAGDGMSFAFRRGYDDPLSPLKFYVQGSFAYAACAAGRDRAKALAKGRRPLPMGQPETPYSRGVKACKRGVAIKDNPYNGVKGAAYQKLIDWQRGYADQALREATAAREAANAESDKIDAAL